MSVVKKLHLAMTADSKSVETAARRVEGDMRRVKAAADNVAKSSFFGGLAGGMLGTTSIMSGVKALEKGFKSIQDAQKRFLEDAQKTGRHDLFVTQVKAAHEAFKELHTTTDSIWLALGNHIAPLLKSVAKDLKGLTPPEPKGDLRATPAQMAELRSYRDFKDVWSLLKDPFKAGFDVGAGQSELFKNRQKALQEALEQEKKLIDAHKKEREAIDAVAAAQRRLANEARIAAQAQADAALQDQAETGMMKWRKEVEKIESAFERKKLFDTERGRLLAKALGVGAIGKADVAPGVGAAELGTAAEFSARQLARREAEGKGGLNVMERVAKAIEELKAQDREQTRIGKEVVEALKKLGVIP